MQELTELDLMAWIVAPVVILIVWWLPILVIMKCRWNNDIGEDSICYRIAQYSKDHPVLLVIIAHAPALILIGVLYPMNDFLFSMLFQVILAFAIVQIIVAWRTKDFLG